MQILYYKNNNCHNLHLVCKYNNFLLFKLLQQTTLYTNAFSYRGIRHLQQIEGTCFVEDRSKCPNIELTFFMDRYRWVYLCVQCSIYFTVYDNQCHVNDISSSNNSIRINFTCSNSLLKLSNARFNFQQANLRYIFCNKVKIQWTKQLLWDIK